jgi:putative Ca2+/H+ antiporter (TMEM165/GDT1 family)
MAALVVGALAQVGDRTAWLAAVLADRYRRPLIVSLMAGIALLVASAAAVIGGIVLAPRMTPEAKQFFLAVALVALGGGSFFPVKALDRLANWRLGTAATSLLGLLILAFGDGLQFVVLALAARSPMPWLAVIGATIGSMAVIVPAVMLGEGAWCALPLRLARRGIGVALVGTGVAIGIAAIGLI